MKILARALCGFSTLALLSAPAAHAISETDYNSKYETEVAPFFATGVSGKFYGVGNKEIRYRTFINPNERAALVIVNGRTETLLKYAEVAYDLYQYGYSIYMIDHRGQGLSERLIKDHNIGYVDHFGDYVTDLKTFVDTVVNATPHAKRFMLGHSMGGAITTLYNELYPNDMDAVVLSSPMLEIITDPYPEFVAYDLASFLTDIGQGAKLAPGQVEFDKTTFKTNIVTHSRVRWEKSAEITAAFPQTYLGGASNRWVQQSMEAGTKARKLVASFKAPLLMMMAQDDKLVHPTAEATFCTQKGASCTPLPLPGSYHEILNERDEIRDKAMSALTDFFAEHL